MVLFVLGLWRLPKTTLLIGLLTAGLLALLITKSISGTGVEFVDQQAVGVATTEVQGYWEATLRSSATAQQAILQRVETRGFGVEDDFAQASGSDS